jgi:hypothetical protein
MNTLPHASGWKMHIVFSAVIPYALLGGYNVSEGYTASISKAGDKNMNDV